MAAQAVMAGSAHSEQQGLPSYHFRVRRWDDDRMVRFLYFWQLGNGDFQ